ncbi:MAG: CusA/CzcA family heavy metal efflux RND transporter [Saprospiraceae bacterium]|nr:CusA/CzcA family heavy metal efflux RND transporter [Candidatus Vicinibacter affinis]
MLNHIIEFSIKNKLLIGLFTIILIVYGLYQVTKLPIDAVPDITNNQVQVITIAPSFGATDIERLVTYPIEQANSNINGLKEIRSFSRFGLSLVTVVFDDATDIYWARQQVAERLQQVQSQIPQGIGTPELGPISTGLGEIYQYVVRPEKGFEKKYDATELRTIQDWIVRRQLLGVKGVAEVSSFGGNLKQYEISVHPDKLQAYHITLQEVFSALEDNNQNTGGAYIEKGPAVLYIRSEGILSRKEDIQSILIKTSELGTPIFLRDVADINIGFATRYGAMCLNDQGEVSGAIVMMLKGANSSEVIKNVKERIIQIQKTLPTGVVIEPFLDRTKMVNNAISTVEKNLLEGALIVVFILVLFLGNFRAGILVASVIPLAMLFAVILMNTFGVSGNLMSLGALDFGLIVDGAVIIVEAVMHQLTHSKSFVHLNRLTQGEMDSNVKSSASKMMNSAVFGQIIILIVYLPIFTLEGIEGKMFKPMAQTVAFALAGAFLLSLTYIPMMSALVLSKNLKHTPNISDKIMFRIEKFYQNLLSKILMFPKTVLLIAFTLFALAIVRLSMLGGEFIPALEEGDFAVDTRVLTGSNLKTTIEHTQKAAHVLITNFPEVEKVVTKIGSGEVPTDPMPMEASDMMVILKDKKKWTSAKTFDELAEKMAHSLENVPGITASFQYPVQMRFNELMTGARQDVVCKIFGEDLDTLSSYAEKMGGLVNAVNGSENLYIEPISGIPQIIINYDRAAVAQYKLNIKDINNVINTAFAGQSAGQIYEGEKRFELVVRLNLDQRKNLDDVRNLIIPTPDGQNIPLNLLAKVEIKNGPNQIQREDAKRRIVVGFNVSGRDIQSIVDELKQKVEENLKLPPGYYVTYGGAFENLIAAKKRLSVAVPVSLIMIFILLFFAFNSIRHSLLIYTAIPLSAIGGILFLSLRGMPFSISAGVGFIALFGVAVLNGIVLIAEFNRQKESGLKDLHRIVIMGSKVRLRPVLMTAMVASLGFLPMALSDGAGAEVQRPLATVVIGGLIVATFLTLFVLPVLYVIFEKNSKMKPGKHSITTIIILILSTSINVFSQKLLTLDEIVDQALKHNLSLKSIEATKAFKKEMIKSAYDIPMTNLSSELGQINSVYTDFAFGINQSFNLPTVYKRQKKLLEKEYQTEIANLSLKEADIKKMIMLHFSNLIILKEKEKNLNKSDSIFTILMEKARLRYQKGESNIMEKTTYEIILGNIQLQKKNIQQNLLTIKNNLKVMMNSPIDFEPEYKDIKLEPPPILTEIKNSQHPIMNLADQKILLATQMTQLEKSKMLPVLNLGYSNMSMRGTGADNVLYTSSKRFNSVQVGIGIPISSKAQKARINAFQLNEQIANISKEEQMQLLQNSRTNSMIDYTNKRSSVEYFEQFAIQNSNILTQTINDQLTKGDINYLEWVMSINQIIAVQNDYLNAVKELNESIIEINYLNSIN